MSKFRKGRLASAMLCTLILGGNAGAIKKDMSKTISKNDLSTKDKELENRKPDDSGNKLLEYFLYCLGGLAGVAKLADEGVGVAQAKNYIENEKLSPLGELSIYKNLAARSYRAKTIETMKNLVAESHKNKENINNFLYEVLDMVHRTKNNKKNCAKVKDNLFDISSAAAGKNFLDIKSICYHANLVGDEPAVPECVEEYVKSVLGVSVEDCDKILVNAPDNAKYAYIAFVKGNVCLKLSPFNNGIEFCLTGISDKLSFDIGDYKLDLFADSNCFAITLPYMEKILGVKHDENYIDISTNGNEEKSYSFYGQIFRDLEGDWKGKTLSGKKFVGQANKIFPDLFAKKEELFELKEELFELKEE